MPRISLNLTPNAYRKLRNKVFLEDHKRPETFEEELVVRIIAALELCEPEITIGTKEDE